MARTYKRDSRGRFAGGGGPSPGGSAPAKVGRSGPRGGKTGTRAEQRRAAREQAARSAQFRGKATGAGRSAREAYRAAAGAARAAGRKGGAMAMRDPAGAIVPARQAARVSATSAAGRKPRIADALRSTLRELAQSDAQFYRGIEQLVGPIKVPKPKPARTSAGATGGGNQRGSVTRALRGTLRDLARSDAARLREIADITRPTSAGAISGSKGSRRRVSGSGASKALPGGTSSKSKPKPKRKR